MKHEAFIGFNNVKISFARGQKNIYSMFYVKYVSYNGEIKCLSKTDVQLKGFDDGGQNLMYGVGFLNCKTNT